MAVIDGARTAIQFSVERVSGAPYRSQLATPRNIVDLMGQRVTGLDGKAVGSEASHVHLQGIIVGSAVIAREAAHPAVLGELLQHSGENARISGKWQSDPR